MPSKKKTKRFYCFVADNWSLVEYTRKNKAEKYRKHLLKYSVTCGPIFTVEAPL